jgi:prepilin-type N-terminal cleavage/methylation domain-containing protein
MSSRPLHRRFSSQAGFTLIELLVVVAIIAVLASLLLPALSRARRAVKLTTCTNSLKQVGLGIAMYTDAHNDYVPGYYWSGGSIGSYCTDAKGNNLVIGSMLADSHGTVHKLIPMAGVQHLLRREGILGDWFWCRDMTYQRQLEELAYPYTSQPQPNYGLPYDFVRHAPCPLGQGGYVQSSRSAIHNEAGKCSHLLKLTRLSANHLLLGEQFQLAGNWPIGYGYSSGITAFTAYQAAFRHAGPRVNLLFSDNHVEAWDMMRWANNVTVATANMKES